MHAATLTARAGHEVTLVESRPALGGQLDLASTGPHKGAVRQLWEHLEEATRAAGVEVITGLEVDESVIRGIDPERIIDATGSSPLQTALRGEPGFPVRTVDEALRTPLAGRGTVVVLGAGPGGIEAALAIADRGLRVTLADVRPRIGVGMVPHTRFHAERLLREAGVDIVTRIASVQADGPRVHLAGRHGDQVVEGVCLLVLAIGRRSTGLEPAIYATSRACVVKVGDAKRPASILEALETARRSAEELVDLPLTRV